jgi:hypothetical protein
MSERTIAPRFLHVVGSVTSFASLFTEIAICKDVRQILFVFKVKNVLSIQ